LSRLCIPRLEKCMGYSYGYFTREFVFKAAFGIRTQPLQKASCTPPSQLGLDNLPPISYRQHFIFLRSTSTISNMLSTKRKALDASLQRRVRARRESSGDVESVASDLPSDNIPGSDDEDNSDSGDSEEEVCPVRSYFRTPLTLISV